MALITLWEIVQLLIMTFVVGYILTGMVQVRPRTIYDMMHKRKFNWTDFKYAIYVSAPAIIIHELGHKFVAMAYGYSATFEMFTWGLAIGLALKLIGSPFILLAPGYVSLPVIPDPFVYRLIAFAGPAVNLILWMGSMYILKNYPRKLDRKWTAVLAVTKKLNMFLFFFNMIPFGPFDGAKVVFGPPG